MTFLNRNDKHDLILAKGAALMTVRGYHGTGVQDIVQSAGVPKGSFYHYFASKEDFAVQALAFIYQPRLSRYALSLADTSLAPLPRILNYYRELIGHFAKQQRPEYHCFIGTLSFEMAQLSQPIGQQVAAILNQSVQILADCLEQARIKGDLSASTDTQRLAEFIANAWEGALMRMKVGGDVEPLEIFLDQLQRFLSAG